MFWLFQVEKTELIGVGWEDLLAVRDGPHRMLVRKEAHGVDGEFTGQDRWQSVCRSAPCILPSGKLT
jgi:hypothetical protein